jgi:hypothetical protein
VSLRLGVRPWPGSLDSLLKLRRAPELMDRASADLHCPLSAAGDTVESSATPNETNEANGAPENVTNEATDSYENATNEPTDARENITNEPNHAGENITNEPTIVIGSSAGASPSRQWHGMERG